jgi:predicted Zn-dependent protease
MARVQLAGFPTGKWDEGQSLDALGAVQPCFDRVLQNDPDNRAANYRLGLIALLQRNFPVAAERLAKAHAASPGHRGITKNLAYSLVWAGDYQRAMALLRRLPEAQNEMDAYTRWWHEQGRDDLARAAYHVLFLLRQGPSGQPESVYGLD